MGGLSGRTVEAITEVTFRKFRRKDINFLLKNDSDFFQRVSRAWIQEREYADSLAVDLGRRMADARIARLIMHLAEMASRRNMMIGQTMPFPLRQRHIADATGLTPNHVTKTLASFQKMGLFHFNNRTLTLGDEAQLRSIAEWDNRLG